MGLDLNARDLRPEIPLPLASPARIFTFGIFELRPDTGELWKHGIRIKVQMKPLRVLEALLQHPGEVVAREELIRKLWPEGTFVDFEAGLNTATNRLRAALGDSGVTPRYIETLPRLGYRFICPVAIVEPREKSNRFSVLVPISSSSSAPAAGPKRKMLASSYHLAAAVLLMVAFILALAYTKLI